MMISAVLLALALLPGVAFAQARMISAFPPGGAVDILARVFAEEIAKSSGRPMVVENITGAGGVLAMQNLKAAAPDGNTLAAIVDSSLVVYPHTAARPLYNALTDFTPIAHAGTTVMALAIGSHVPAKDLAEFVAWAKGNPDKSSFGASGGGATLQFYGGLIGQAVGVPLVHVPYKGVGPAVADMVGGQIAASIAPMGPLQPHLKSGKARALAHSGSARIPSARDVPTFRELGYPALELPVWFGVVGPAGMKPDVAARINETLVQAMRMPAVRERMARLDLEVRELNAAEFAALVKSDYERWGRIVKASGWKPSD
jgi:tripartite-type tricarboxylate transporter receptor subunit TctC